MSEEKIVRLGILHVQVITGNMHNNHRVLGEAMAIAAGYDCSAVLTGELIECGSYFWKNIGLQTIPVGIYPYLNHLQQVAYKYKMHIFIGRAEQEAKTGFIYSSYTHINKTGKICATYHKQIIEGIEEKTYLNLGNQIIITQMDKLKVALFIGYNDEIKRLMRYSKAQGADLIICAVAPTYHFNLREEASGFNQDLQPAVFCSYDLSIGEQFFTGESVYLGKGKGGVIRPQCPTVIVIDYEIESGTFKLVRCIDVNSMLH